MTTQGPLWELLLLGGPVMILLVLMGGAVLAIFLERWFFYRRESMNVAEFLRGILTLIRKRSFSEALDRCDEAHGPAVLVVRTALENHSMPREELREVLNEVASLQVPRLEKSMHTLGNIALLAPLLGLLGTVAGMTSVFMTIQRADGTATTASLAGGVWEALLTTAAGLIVCVAAISARQFCAANVRQFCDEMRRAAVETLLGLSQAGRVTEFPSPQLKQPSSSAASSSGRSKSP